MLKRVLYFLVSLGKNLNRVIYIYIYIRAPRAGLACPPRGLDGWTRWMADKRDRGREGGRDGWMEGMRWAGGWVDGWVGVGCNDTWDGGMEPTNNAHHTHPHPDDDDKGDYDHHDDAYKGDDADNHDDDDDDKGDDCDYNHDEDDKDDDCYDNYHRSILCITNAPLRRESETVSCAQAAAEDSSTCSAGFGGDDIAGADLLHASIVGIYTGGHAFSLWLRARFVARLLSEAELEAQSVRQALCGGVADWVGARLSGCAHPARRMWQASRRAALESTRRHGRERSTLSKRVPRVDLCSKETKGGSHLFVILLF